MAKTDPVIVLEELTVVDAETNLTTAQALDAWDKAQAAYTAGEKEANAAVDVLNEEHKTKILEARATCEAAKAAADATEKLVVPTLDLERAKAIQERTDKIAALQAAKDQAKAAYEAATEPAAAAPQDADSDAGAEAEMAEEPELV